MKSNDQVCSLKVAAALRTRLQTPSTNDQPRELLSGVRTSTLFAETAKLRLSVLILIAAAEK